MSYLKFRESATLKIIRHYFVTIALNISFLNYINWYRRLERRLYVPI